MLRINSGAFATNKGYIMGAPAGTPDLICCSPKGKFVAIEVKRPKNEPTPLQYATIHHINDVGGDAIWVQSLEELISDLKKLGH